MLVASSNMEQSQDLFRLVLSLISSGTEDIPESLKEHFVTVLSQAKALVNSPLDIENALSESIDLALEIRGEQEISNYLDKIHDVENVTPALAHKLLESMERYSVHQD